MFTFKKPILATSNSRFVSWLVQFLSEFLSLIQYFVYFWIVKCRNTPRDKAAKRYRQVYNYTIPPKYDILRIAKNIEFKYL